MENDTMQVKTDGQDTRSMSKKKRSRILETDAKLKASLKPKVCRRRCAIGLPVSKTISYEELFTWLSLFAAEQWEQLPRHASDWERGQVDGLFWAMDKLDELVEK